MSSPPSSSNGAAPRRSPGEGGGHGGRPSSRPSPARAAPGTSWEASDIRGDLAAGWGGGVDNDDDALPAGRKSNKRSAARDGWGWRLRDDAVQSVPAYLPVDPRGSRAISLADGRRGSLSSAEDVALRLSDACRMLSVHALWDDASPTAKLSSMEGVEMEINIYSGAAATAPSPQVSLLVEVQRTKGCSVTFHNYRRRLLDAAEGKFEPLDFDRTDGLDKPSGRDRCNQPRASLGRPNGRPSLTKPSSLARPSPGGRPGLAKPGRLSGLSRPSLCKPSPSGPSLGRPSAPQAPPAVAPRSPERTLEALTTAASLLRKDRVDARRVGVESLALLTDPLRAGPKTAQMASSVVLLGTTRMDAGSKSSAEEDVDALFDETDLGIRKVILEMILSHNDKDKLTVDVDGHRRVEREFTDELYRLCLEVLSNALRNIASASEKFLDDAKSDYDGDVISALLEVLDRARTDPHDACRSARCLGPLFRGCGRGHRARAMGKLDAKRVLGAALEVGRGCHRDLEDASRAAMEALAADA
ncbi:hypothetical protein ACHAWF_005657 [Thalassiosira exigua]